MQENKATQPKLDIRKAPALRLSDIPAIMATAKADKEAQGEKNRAREDARREREATKWARRKARWAAFKKETN